MFAWAFYEYVAVPIEMGAKLIVVEKKFGRLEYRTLDVVSEIIVALAHFFDVLRGSLQYMSFLNDERIGGKVVEQRIEGGEEKRQVIFDAARRDAFADILVDAAATHVHIKGVVPALAKAGNASCVEGKLLGGQKLDAGYSVHRALSIRIERSQALDFIVQQIYADWVVETHRKDIHERATYRKLTMAGNGFYSQITRRSQPLSFGCDVEALAEFNRHAVAVDVGTRDHSLQERFYGHNEHRLMGIRQPLQGAQAFRNDVLMGRKSIVRQGFPVGKVQELNIAPVELEGRQPALCATGVVTDDER